MSLCFSCALFSLHYPAGSLWLSPCPYSLLCHCWAIVCFCSLARVASLGLQVGASRLQLWGSRLAHLRSCLRLSPLACWDLLLLVAPSFRVVAFFCRALSWLLRYRGGPRAGLLWCSRFVYLRSGQRLFSIVLLSFSRLCALTISWLLFSS